MSTGWFLGGGIVLSIVSRVLVDRRRAQREADRIGHVDDVVDGPGGSTATVGADLS